MRRVMRTLPDVKSRYSSSIRWERTVGDAERLKKEEVESSRPLIPFAIEEGERERERGRSGRARPRKQTVGFFFFSLVHN